MAQGDVHLDIREVGKSFGGTRALDDVSIAIHAGSVHAFVGENGAGKSTLGKIVAGVFPPDQGELSLRGEPVAFRSPREALQRGIALVAQEVAVVPQRTVAENVFLGNEPRRLGFVRRRTLLEQFERLVADTGLEVPANAVVGSLPLAKQQQVEILRALARDAELIVFDEPTAALSATEVQRFHEIVRGLAAGGRTVILVSHFLGEVLALADTITSCATARSSRPGPPPPRPRTRWSPRCSADPSAGPTRRSSPPPPTPRPALTVRDLTAAGVNGASLEVRAGEIVALAGLVGAGRSELARAIFGASPSTAGEMTAGTTPPDRHAAGLAPGERLDDPRVAQGRRPDAPPAGPGERQPRQPPLARPVRLRPPPAGVDPRARSADAASPRRASSRPSPAALSGGNQQKLMFARALLADPAVLIADEPTRGVDVGAKRDLYELLVDLAASGVAILLISNEIEEILGLAHRVLVMRGGPRGRRARRRRGSPRRRSWPHPSAALASAG